MRFLILYLIANISFAEIVYKLGIGSCVDQDYPTPAWASLEKESINLFDDGSAFRKYQHISDCCIMLINILLKGKHEVYNVGGKEETTIYDMAKIIGDRFGKEVVKGKVNNDVASSAPKKVSISLDRYEEEFDEFEFTTFKSGMENYLN